MQETYFKAFDIVESNYVDLNGNKKAFPDTGKDQKGLFVILAVSYGCAICCKLTSQFKYKYSGGIVLRTDKHPFLLTESVVQTDKLQTLSLSSLEKIGSVDYSLRPLVIENQTKCFGFIRKQMDEERRIRYFSPNTYRNNYKFMR